MPQAKLNMSYMLYIIIFRRQLLSFLYMNMYHVCMWCIYRCETATCTCLQIPEDCESCFKWSFFAFFHWEFFFMNKKLTGFPCLYFPQLWDHKCRRQCMAVYINAGDLNSSPCVASQLYLLNHIAHILSFICFYS